MANETMDRNRESNQTQGTQQTGKLTDYREFTTPTLGLARGRSVSVRGIGNQEGHSPVYLLWDEQGQTLIESVNQVTIIDVGALPPATTQIKDLLRRTMTK